MGGCAERRGWLRAVDGCSGCGSHREFPGCGQLLGAITSVSLALPEGISVKIIEFGNRLRLSNAGDQVVSVPGYSSEPYLQIGPDGVRRNVNSPATYLNSSRMGPRHCPIGPTHRSTRPGSASVRRTCTSATAAAGPGRSWRLTPGDRVDSAAGDRRSLLLGCRRAGLDAAAAGVGLLRSPGRVGRDRRRGGMVVALAASGYGLDRPRLRGFGLACGEHPAALRRCVVGRYGLLAVLLPTLMVLALSFCAVRAVRRPPVVGGSGSAPYLIVISGWLLVVEALPDLDVLFRSNVAAIGPDWGARLAILLLLGLGLGLAIGCSDCCAHGQRPCLTSLEPS